MNNIIFVGLACGIILGDQLAPSMLNRTGQGQPSRLLAATSSATPTHYMENFLIIRDKDNKEVAKGLPLGPLETQDTIIGKIDLAYRDDQIPYIISFYDVDNLEPFQGIYLIVVKWEAINSAGRFITPHLKVYSPIVEEVSTDYKVFTSSTPPQDIFITHIRSGPTKIKSLTEIFSQYKDNQKIRMILADTFSFRGEETLMCDAAYNFRCNPTNKFTAFVQRGNLKGRNKSIVLRRPLSISPDIMARMRQKADDEVAVEQEHFEILKAAFECPGNRDLYTQLVKNVKFICSVLQFYKNLPPVVRPSVERPQSPPKLVHLALRRADDALRNRAVKQLHKMIPSIYELTNDYYFTRHYRIMRLKKETRLEIATRLNGIVEETERYLSGFRENLSSSIFNIPYSVTDIVQNEEAFSHHRKDIIKIFLGKELEDAIFKQTIARGIE